MKRCLLWAFVLMLCSPLLPQEAFIKHSLVINIEVPVRVYTGGSFIDNLTIDDFEVWENSIPQKIEAVYLVNKRSIERSQEKKQFKPETARHFFLFFEMADYMPKIGEALSNFVNNIFLPGDNLIIITPLSTYKLRAKLLALKSRAEVVDEITAIIRKDTVKGNAHYRSIIRDLEKTAQILAALLSEDKESIPYVSMAGRETGVDDPEVDINHHLIYYSELIGQLETMRQVDQMKLLDFARYLRAQEGQKYVFVFYQREFSPQIDSRILSQFQSSSQEKIGIQMTLSNLMEFNSRDISIDVDEVKRAYADASTAIHFLFITKPAKTIYGIRMEEHSEDIFAAFNEMSQATGGLMLSSANPSFAFQKALDASENYYLLYYVPKDYAGDGEFKTIKVKVKGKDYNITHRKGYFAY